MTPALNYSLWGETTGKLKRRLGNHSTESSSEEANTTQVVDCDRQNGDLISRWEIVLEQGPRPEARTRHKQDS